MSLQCCSAPGERDSILVLCKKKAGGESPGLQRSFVLMSCFPLQETRRTSPDSAKQGLWLRQVRDQPPPEESADKTVKTRN